MKLLYLLSATILLAVLGSTAPTVASQDNVKANKAPDLSGLHDFDLRVGSWACHHRRLKERLVGSHEWQEFDGTQELHLMMGGYVNVDDNTFNLPGGAYQGMTMRAYDPSKAEWSIWWLDGRRTGELDPPVKGRFVHGVGTFYATDTLRGKPVRVRFIWSGSPPRRLTGNRRFPAMAARPGKSTGRPTSRRSASQRVSRSAGGLAEPASLFSRCDGGI